MAQISVGDLRAGMRLSHDIYDQAGVRLLAAGAVITPEFVRLLQHRGIQWVCTRPLPVRSSGHIVRTTHVRRLERLLAEHLEKRLPLRAIGASQRPRLPLAVLVEKTSEGLEKHMNARVFLADLHGRMETGRRISKTGVHTVVSEFAEMAALDLDLLPIIISMQQASQEYLFDHCVNVALYSMVIATQLGLPPEQVTEVGLGGLLADVGMLRVPESIRLANRPLTAEERSEVARHPAHTVEYLECIQGLPLAAKFAAYQSHERVDGSGYPHNRSGLLIHQYAKIVAVADAYSAMIGLRPYRRPVSPYGAAKQILIENSQSKFDRIMVRAFLDCVSLFPIGSIVGLSDGREGIVFRANTGCHTRPLVKELGVDGRPTGCFIDLSKEPDLKVIRTGPAPESPGR